MIQRVGIAQAMLNDPKILILDEPTAGLDPKERVRLRNLLSELGRNRIVILSTHIVSDVESIANEIIMLKDQKVLFKDSIENICHQLKDRVFEKNMSYEDLIEFRKQYHSLSEKQEEGMMKVRFIGAKSVNSSWKPVVPNLEDVFLSVYQDTV